MTKNKAAKTSPIRRPHENYPTPPAVALAITQRVAEVVGPVKYVVEPSAGSGSFVKAARMVFPPSIITAVDIRPEVREQCRLAGADGFWQGDWPAFLAWDGGLEPGSLVIGNPPFRTAAHGAAGDLATQHALATLECLEQGHLAFLLPLSYHAGKDRTRRLWARRDLYAWFPLAARPKFVDDHHANSEYAVFIWRAGFRGNAVTLPSLLVEG